MRNLEAKVPIDRWGEFKSQAWDAYTAASPKLGEILRDQLVAAWQRDLPTAVSCFLDDFEACIAHLKLPLAHRKAARTTNLLERLFGEERRRTKTIPHAFGERPVLKLMYAALIRASESWRGVKVTEFETRQLQALREDLQRAHTERVSPVVRVSTESRPAKASSKTKT